MLDSAVRILKSRDIYFDPVAAKSEQPESTTGTNPEVWTLRRALRTPTFWMVSLGLLLSGWTGGGIGFLLVPYFTDKGLTAGIAVAGVSAFALTGALAAPMWGALSERFSVKVLISGATIIGAGLTASGLLVNGPFGVLIFTSLFGFTIRGQNSLAVMLIVQHFGRHAFGAISGSIMQFLIVGLGIGPVAMTLIFDVSNSYLAVFTLGSVLLLGSAILFWIAPTPTYSAKLGPPPNTA